MSVFRRAGIVLFCLLVLAPVVRAAQAQPPPATEGFVQANDLPSEEQLPAAPMVVAAYTIFLVLIFGYVWSINSRLNTVEKEMRTLGSRQAGGGGAR